MLRLSQERSPSDPRVRRASLPIEIGVGSYTHAGSEDCARSPSTALSGSEPLSPLSPTLAGHPYPGPIPETIDGVSTAVIFRSPDFTASPCITLHSVKHKRLAKLRVRLSVEHGPSSPALASLNNIHTSNQLS
eukprot:TRINITY_DN49468_c0_g1_i3.p2 TRINITY_DN49468_c0_g1~~TRINITY_DN49468_c0_g1_i3.p2  ORF type:complete len:133 (+),score=12.23 TRINITY_DN49468_c0_g1_i3:437-835(+)